MSVVVFALFGVILYLLMERSKPAPVSTVRIVERRPVRWMPWSWGAGGYNGSGTTIVHRPVPHFGKP
jgi:hypothetical protein